MEREHASMPSLIVDVPDLGPVTLVANGGGYYVHSGDPNGGDRPFWTINGVDYTGSVHVEQPEPGKTWVVPWPTLSRHPWSSKDATESAYTKFTKVLRAFIEQHAETPEGAAHLRAGCIASANNDALGLSGRLAEIHDHHKNVRTAHEMAEARCAALDADQPDPGRVDSPDTPRFL